MWRRACPASACGSRALQQDVHPAHHDPADLRQNMMKMKMAVVSEISLLLLFCCSVIFPTESLANCSSYAATGEAFAVPLGYNLKEKDRVKWWRGPDVIVERKPGPPGTKYTFHKGGENHIYPNGSLKLMNVSKSDANEYIPAVFSADGKSEPNLKSTRLCVLDRVPQPTLNIVCHKTQLIVTCQVAQERNLNFSWFHNNNLLKNNYGPKLVLELKDLKQGMQSFSCKVYNQVSALTSQTVSSNCNNFFFTDLWTLIYISVGGGGGLVIILTIIVIACCVRAKRKKRMQKTDEEELRLRWANPEQRQQHECPQHGHPTSHQRQHQHQQQPAGHTGPRQHRSKQHREQQHRPRAQESTPPPPPPQPGPRRAAQVGGSSGGFTTLHTTKAEVNGDDEKPPPLPQPRTKTPRTRQV
ncbi:T-cell surface antigen CD2 isoform X3 [Paralichthys olivaceus]|uniref:T-cell surface antigen CD2 isoform X3 n=1 Tax=Paralichthys olivaceus TaxID=8255 RepID=UPI00375065C4